MTQTLTLTLEPGSDLGIGPVFRAAPLILTGSVIEGVTSYTAKLWRRPTDIRSDVDPLLIANGSITEGTVRIGFTAEQMDFDLTAEGGRYDDIWLTVSGLQSDGQSAPLIGGWVRFEDVGHEPFTQTGETVIIEIIDDRFTFDYAGLPYSFPVVEMDDPPDGVIEGQVVVIDDLLIATIEGQSYAAPVAQVITAAPVTALAADIRVETDRLLIVQDDETYATPVVQG